MFKGVLLLIWLVLAQVDGPSLQVFLRRDLDLSGDDELLFVDSLTGDEIPVVVNGTNYTLAGRSVIFFDLTANRVMVATPDGDVRQHPFIQPTAVTRRIDWVVSRDKARIAWTRTEVDSEGALTTITSIANLNGDGMREVLQDGPRNGIRALPVAFNREQTLLYMDYQPDAIADFTPFQQYAGIFALDLDSGEVSLLPGEPGCFCGAGLQGGLFLRLNLNEDLSGYDLVLHNLMGQVSHTIPALRLVNYTLGGDVLISPDGSKAVYALAQVRQFGGENQSVRTVIALIDLDRMTQSALTDPITTFVQPVEWTEDNTAVIFTSPMLDGTWKVNLEDGRLARVAAATYLGTIR